MLSREDERNTFYRAITRSTEVERYSEEGRVISSEQYEVSKSDYSITGLGLELIIVKRGSPFSQSGRIGTGKY